MRATFFDKYTAPELGTTKTVDPALLPNPAGPPPFVVNPGVRGTPVKMLDVSCEDKWATDVTISIRTEYELDPNTGNPAVGSPIVGTLQWGIGGGENQIEFDIPSARVPDQMAPAGIFPRAPMVANGNGLQIYLAGTSHVSLTVRNDGSMTALTNPASTVPIGFVARAKVIAFISPGGSGNRPLDRCIVLAITSDPLVPIAAVPGTFVEVTVPPFAKFVRFERTNAAGLVEPLLLQFWDRSLGNIIRTATLGANEEGPIPLSPQTQQIRVFNQGAANMTRLTAVFDVTPT